MDNADEAKPATPKPPLSLSLPFDAAEMMSVRLLPVEFARLLGVSKQSVSRWIKAGKVTLGVDGRLDPTKATRELLNKADLGRLRVRILKAAVADTKDMMAAFGRVSELESELAKVRATVEYLETFSQELDAGHMYFLKLLAENEKALRSTPGTNEFVALLTQLDDEASLSFQELPDI
jgi:predicted transcriptional regulator